MAGSQLTASDFGARAQDALLTPRSPLSEAVVKTSTSNAGLVVGASKTLGIALQRQIQEGVAGAYLGSARGPALDRLIQDRYGLYRQGAGPGVGTVSLTRPTAGYGAITLAVRQTMTVGAVTVALTQAASFGPVDLGPVLAFAQTT